MDLENPGRMKPKFSTWPDTKRGTSERKIWLSGCTGHVGSVTSLILFAIRLMMHSIFVEAYVVIERNLFVGDTKQIKITFFGSVWSLCGAANVEKRVVGEQGEAGVAVVFHVLENQTESH